ncbi:MAG: cardiolipin synthase [Xanthomonadaceae bacterium]|nr:cardiolipin synthase [Xanthomonadaceae bacterium]MDE1965031.1 cardiolipin synthase [Xanthomonadaceae bacterium]
MLTDLIALTALVLHSLGVIAAMHAVVHARTPQGALAWALGLVLLPYVTLVPYLYLGSSQVHGYLETPRQSPGAPPEEAGTHPACLRLDALAALAGRPFRRGHALQLLVNGEAAFAAMFAAIAGAHNEVLAQFFIVHDDVLGQRFAAALQERAAAGVRVHLLYDGIGSHDLPESYLEALRGGGVQVHAFAGRRWRNRFQLNFRNHRKLLLVDGVQGFVGGLNVGDEYLGARPPLSPWRDTHLGFVGPAVADLRQAFADDWRWTTGARLPAMAPPAPRGDASVLLVTSGPADPQETGSLCFTALIHAARTRLWLSTPYFVPDAAVLAALQLAVLRGVDVRVLIPSRPDHRGVFLASSLHAHEAVQRGIGVYRYQPGFLHQKALLLDDHTAAIGSMNLDSRSFRLNFELATIAVDDAFARTVEVMLREDLAHCLPVTAAEYRRSPYLRRVAMHVARLFDPIL